MGNPRTQNPPQPPVRRSMGKRIPNLIFQYDSEKGSEFRIQCEVPLDNEDVAAGVKKDVMMGTVDSLKRARKQILDLVDPGATEMFRQVVGQAFDANIKDIEDQAAQQRGVRR